MTANCKSGFSLLEPHVCSVVPKPKVTPSPGFLQVVYPETTLNGGPSTADSVKRKASSTPSTEDGRSEKRARTEPEEVDTTVVALPSESMVSGRET
jgi:transducin (beta)-like 1